MVPPDLHHLNNAILYYALLQGQEETERIIDIEEIATKSYLSMDVSYVPRLRDTNTKLDDLSPVVRDIPQECTTSFKHVYLINVDF